MEFYLQFQYNEVKIFYPHVREWDTEKQRSLLLGNTLSTNPGDLIRHLKIVKTNDFFTSVSQQPAS